MHYVSTFGFHVSKKIAIVQMFDLSLDGKVLQTTQFFRDDLQFTTVQMNRVVRWPQVFNYSVDNNLRLKVDYFRSLGLSREAVARYSSIT